MPYVRRDKPFNPQQVDGLIAHYDNYNLITQTTGTQNISPYTFYDKSDFANNAIGNITYTSNTISRTSKVIFNDYNYAYTTQTVLFEYEPRGFTLFYVGFPGFSKDGNSLISLFNKNSNSILASNAIFLRVSNNNIAFATNLSLTADPLYNYKGDSLLLTSGNSISIISATFNGTNSEIFVNGRGSSSGRQPCGNIFPVGDTSSYIIQIHSNGGFNTNGFNSLNSFNEALIYNRILGEIDRISIEKYLANKWSLNYPSILDTTFKGTIPNLILWYNLRDRISFNLQSATSITSLNDLSGYTNNISVSGNYYLYNGLGFITSFRTNLFSPNNYSNYLIGNKNIQSGFTVSFVIQNTFYIGTNQYQNSNIGNIMSIFAPPSSSLNLVKYPTIATDSNYNIITSDNFKGRTSTGYPLFIGNNTAITDTCVITAIFNDYITYGTTQLFLNGYPMLTSTNGPSKWLNSNFNMYFCGATCNTIPTSGIHSNSSFCQLDLGETIIYNRPLTQPELNAVHYYMLSNYSISSNISIDGLVGWFDANDYSSSNGQTMNRWASKSGSVVMSNIGIGSYPLIRNFISPNNRSNTYIDFNNGSPSFLTNSTQIKGTFDNLLIFFAALPNSNYTGVDSAYISLTDSNLQPTFIAQSNSYTNVNFINFKGVPTQIYSQSLISKSNMPLIVGAYSSSATGPVYTKFAVASQTSNNLSGLQLSAQNMSNLSIGGLFGSNFCYSQIGEIIIYNRSLLSNEYVNVMGYLQSKWAYPITVTYPRDILFNYDANVLASIQSWSNSVNSTKNNLTYTGGSLSIITGQNNQKYFNFGGGGYFRATVDFYLPNDEYTIFTVSCNYIPSGSGCVMALVDNSTPRLSPVIESFNDTANNRQGYNLKNKLEKMLSTYKTNGVNYGTNINISWATYKNGFYSIHTKGASNEDTPVYNIENFCFTNIDGIPRYLTIGAYYDGIAPSCNYNGYIGQVIMYNRGLNDYEIKLVCDSLAKKWIG